MDTTITTSISVHTDGDGFMSLECPGCKGQFKMKFADYKSDTVSDIYCTFCGLSESGHQFKSGAANDAMMRKAMNHARAVAEDLINNAFGNLKSSKYIKVTQRKANLGRDAEIDVFEDDDMSIVKFSCCSKELKVTTGNEGSLLYCSFCGVNN